MNGYGFFYFIAEAFRGLRANGLVNLLAVGTISMAMLIVGFFLLAFINLDAAVNRLGDRVGISVYMRDGLTDHEKEYLLAELSAEPGVKGVAYVSKTDALALFKNEFKGQEKMLQGLGENPLPDSYEVNADPRFADKLEAMAKKFSRYPGVEDVSYGEQGAELLSGMYRLITYGGGGLAILLGISVIFIISNSVRLALYSRSQEIELMQWIGATRGFIQGPFLIEGMMLAMLGSGLAIGFIAALYYALPPDIIHFFSKGNGLDFLPTRVVLYLIFGGGILGFAGALVSVTRFLE